MISSAMSGHSDFTTAITLFFGSSVLPMIFITLVNSVINSIFVRLNFVFATRARFVFTHYDFFSALYIGFIKNMTSLSEITSPKNSPELEARRLDANIHIKNTKLEMKKDRQAKEWRSCCLTVDRDAVIFISQMAVLGCLVAYSSVQLAYTESCDKSRIWSGILTLCVGLILPSPKLR